MPFEPHGDFEITRKGEIFILRFYHSWNLKGAEAFLANYKALVLSSNLERFGVLSDLKELEGGTPEAIDYFTQISDWAQKQGQIARALIVDTALKKFTINLIDKGKERFPIRLVNNQEEAFGWFATLGLSAS